MANFNVTITRVAQIVAQNTIASASARGAQQIVLTLDAAIKRIVKNDAGDNVSGESNVVGLRRSALVAQAIAANDLFKAFAESMQERIEGNVLSTLLTNAQVELEVTDYEAGSEVFDFEGNKVLEADGTPMLHEHAGSDIKLVKLELSDEAISLGILPQLRSQLAALMGVAPSDVPNTMLVKRLIASGIELQRAADIVAADAKADADIDAALAAARAKA